MKSCVDCGDNINTDLIVWEGVAWIKTAQIMDQWRDIVDTMMGILVPQNRRI